MKRLYFTVPSVDRSRRIVQELRRAGLSERDLYVIAKDHTMLPQSELPEANPLQQSGFAPAVEHGLAAGGDTGLLASVAAVSYPASGLALGGGAVLTGEALDAGFDAWFSDLTGREVDDDNLRRFEQAIESGHLLILVDVLAERSDDISERIRATFPKVHIEAAELPSPELS